MRKSLVLMIVCMVNESNKILCEYEWVHPMGRDVQTVFYQGINASQTQVSKYTGARGFVATTGERITCSKGLDIIEKPFIGKELDELQLKKTYTKKYEEIKYFFRHPLCVAQQYINNIFENKFFGITIQQVCPDRQETVAAHSIHVNIMSLAQDKDIAEHHVRYDLCVHQCPDSDMILYGVSRGAATTFNACAFNHYDRHKIRLVVLEGCFDSVAGALQDCPFFLHCHSLAKVFVRVISAVTQFKADGVAPIKLVDQFPEDIPVIFITSARDCVVSMASVQRLVDALKLRGKNPLYMLVLAHSSHPKYTMSNSEDAENYRDCMHALYKKFNLPYIYEYAQLGESKKLLDRCFLR